MHHAAHCAHSDYIFFVTNKNIVNVLHRSTAEVVYKFKGCPETEEITALCVQEHNHIGVAGQGRDAAAFDGLIERGTFDRAAFPLDELPPAQSERENSKLVKQSMFGGGTKSREDGSTSPVGGSLNPDSLT